MQFRGGSVFSLVLVASLSIAVAAAMVSPSSGHGQVNGTIPTHSPDFGNEGILILAPVDGINREMVEHGDPAMLSWTFSDKEEAVRVVLESNNRGDEPLCLSDLGPQKPEFHVARYWVFSC
jgi:hypothetical protein